MGLPMGQKLVKSGSTWARLCETYISKTAEWIYNIRSSRELSRHVSVVVQYHGHLTLILDFQGQILKMLYLRNGRADWQGTKGMWVDRILDQHYDFELWPHPSPWPLIFKVKFWKSRNSGMGCPVDMERKGCESGMRVDWMLDPCCDGQLWPHAWPWPWIFNINMWHLDTATTGRIFYRGVSGFATDCPCSVWCCGLTTCLLYVHPPFGTRLLNNSWAVGLT